MLVKKTFFRTSAFLLLLACVTMLSGCASGPVFQKVSSVPTDKALIYVYRPMALGGGMYVPTVKIGNGVSFSLSNGGYFPYVTSPGQTEISISNLGTRSVTVDAVAGETYYVKGGLVFMGLGIPYIELETAELGADEIKDCKRVDSNEGTSGASAAAPVAPPVAATPAENDNQATMLNANVAALESRPATPSGMAQNTGKNNDPVVFGLSSITVEKLAKLQGCRPVVGATVIARNGPTLEDYKVNCEDGRQLFAHCEYRQCAIK